MKERLLFTKHASTTAFFSKSEISLNRKLGICFSLNVWIEGSFSKVKSLHKSFVANNALKLLSSRKVKLVTATQRLYPCENMGKIAGVGKQGRPSEGEGGAPISTKLCHGKYC